MPNNPHQQYRDRIQRAHEQLMAGLPHTSGRLAARNLTAVVDTIMLEIWEMRVERTPVRAALFALGGYARDELSPHSDIDLLLLYEGSPTVLEPFAEAFRTDLYDAGFRLGFGSRTVEENLDIIHSEPTAATALVDARMLVSSAGYAPPDLRQLTRETLRDHGENRLLDALSEGMTQRHKRFGDSVYLLEPNLKNGRGGMRDVQTIAWAAAVLFDLDRLSALESIPGVNRLEAHRVLEAYDFIMMMRHHLHDESGWKNDRLTFPLQESVAHRMGYRHLHRNLAVESLMGAYYRHASTVQERTQRWLERWQLRDLHPVGVPLETGLPLELRHGRLAGIQTTAVEVPGVQPSEFGLAARKDPTLWATLFCEAAKQRARFYPDFAEEIAHAARHLRDDWHQQPAVARALLELFGREQVPRFIIQSFVKLGPFYKALPEFLPVHGWVHHDVYHVYAVDVHSVLAHKTASEFLSRTLPESPAWFDTLARGLNRPHVFLFAALLHDVGKGRGGDHSEIGERLVGDIGERLEAAPDTRGGVPWSRDDTKTLQWLVRCHLHLSQVSQRRDLSDPATIEELVDFVGTVERLELLTALTIVDARAVRANTVDAWKETLLLQLFSQTRLMLESPWQIPQRLERRRKQLVAHLTREGRSEHVPLVDELPANLLAAHSVATSAAAVSALARAKQSQQTEVESLIAAGIERGVVIAAPDAHGLLADLAGALTLMGAEIARASVYTTDGAMAIDIYECVDDAVLRRPGFAEALAKTAAELALGTVNLEEAISDRGIGSTRRRVPEVANRIHVRNDVSDLHTVVEVRTRDRPGLLAKLARTLSDAGVDIHVSLVSTEGVKAIDVFYVSEGNGQISAARAGSLQKLLKTTVEAFQNTFRDPTRD